MIFYYVRHGDPIYDPDSLTPLGKRQAEAVAKRLSVYGLDEIYASTSNRAILTATPTAEILKKEIKPESESDSLGLEATPDYYSRRARSPQ